MTASPSVSNQSRADAAPADRHPSGSAVLLDLRDAWRRDVANARLGLRAEQAESHSGTWFQIAHHLEQLKSLPVNARALYARQGDALWREIGRETREPRYGLVADAMASWTSGAPGLPAVRELLWVIEQVEAEGAVYTAYNAAHSLSMLVPDEHLTAGYIRAQTGRMFRTLGLLPQALAAYEYAVRVALRENDRWLLARAYLGIGVVRQASGTYGTAREAFGHALQIAEPYRDVLAAAHLGLAAAAALEKYYDDAVDHAWTAFDLATGDPAQEVAALTVLAALSVNVREFAAARRSCEAAFARSPRLPMLEPLTRSIVQASLALGDHANVERYLPDLIKIAGNAVSTWERAHSLLLMAEYRQQRADFDVAMDLAAQALSMAQRHGYNEIAWFAGEMLSECGHGRRQSDLVDAASASTSRRSLRDSTVHVIDRLESLQLA